ncbi:hypothetical protein DBR40_26125 [Pedobacter sp. KBW01]|nr:hypothetical protein DBR40_26125 [Pedobacter sp. KBW01]
MKIQNRYSPVLNFRLCFAVLAEGINKGFCTMLTLKMKYLLCHLAPVGAVPCNNEVRGSEAYRRKTGSKQLFCTGFAFQKNVITSFNHKALFNYLHCKLI